MEKPTGCGVVRRDRHVKQRQSVAISRADWQIAREAVRADCGMYMGEFIGLLLRNWTRRRWPLDLGL